VNLCPACGHPIRDWVHVRTSPLPGEDFPALKRYQKQIFEAVQKAGKNGIHSERLFYLLYSHDPNGGPNFSGLAAIVAHLNRKLKPHGVKVFAGRGGDRVYRLVKL
jgi:hypothetical protein